MITIRTMQHSPNCRAIRSFRAIVTPCYPGAARAEQAGTQAALAQIRQRDRLRQWRGQIWQQVPSRGCSLVMRRSS